MNKTIYRILLCLSVCALLLLVFIGCKDQSGTKNDPVVTTKKVYEYEYQRILEDNGYSLVENAVKVSPKKHLDKDYPASYLDFFKNKANDLEEPYLFIGEKVKSETYVKDLGVFLQREVDWNGDDNVATVDNFYIEKKDVLTVTTVRVDEIVKKYIWEDYLTEGMYIHIIEYSYALPEDVICYDGVYYNYKGLLNPQNEDYEWGIIGNGYYYYGSLYNAIPEGKCLFFVDMNDMRNYSSDYRILCNNMEINFGDESIVQENWYFISLEENLMKETLQTDPHPYIAMAQDDYARSKEEK